MQIIHGAFESVRLPAATYDLVFAAQAFHWIPKDVRLLRSWDLLRPGGSLASLHNYTPEQTDPVHAELSAELEAITHGGMARSDYRNDIALWTSEFASSSRFCDLQVKHYSWTATYTVQQYQGLFQTYSDYLTLSCAMQKAVSEAIAGVIGRHGGIVDRTYDCVLYHMRKFG